jgi:predicted PurR-regulated permease PerM
LPFKGKWLKTKRISIIVLIFIVILGLVTLFVFYLVTAIVDSFSILITNAPDYIAQGITTIQEWAELLRQQFPLELQHQVDEFILDLGIQLGNALRETFMKGLTFVPSTFGMVLGFISLPIFLFYLLKDSKRFNEGFYSVFPPGMAVHARKLVSIIDHVLGRYIRAQLLLGVVVACLVFIGLKILDIELALALSVFAGLTELIPILGPWLGGIVGVLVALATAPDKAIWVAVVYFAVQQLENIFLVPRIQGGYLHINPAILVVLLVLGAYIAGFWGILLIAPLTATVVEIVKYVTKSVREAGEQQVEGT